MNKTEGIARDAVAYALVVAISRGLRVSFLVHTYGESYEVTYAKQNEEASANDGGSGA